MHVHILGICGTFMAGVATLARQMGYRVSGSDLGIYPPMSTFLENEGIEIIQGYDSSQLKPAPDIVVIGNAMSRGNPCVEAVLNDGLSFTSGPQFIKEYVLKNRWVLCVAGTHGKTSTTGMLAWLLEDNGLKPGFLIGGIPGNFSVSARLGGETPFFIIEADEYDTAFFDKRSKFLHYLSRTTILNNLEFDHADIFADLDAIKRQFHHFVRTLPSNGKILFNAVDQNINDTLAMGCWSQTEALGKETGWWASKVKDDGSCFDVYFQKENLGQVQWELIGEHNIQNALAAIGAARHVGIRPQEAIESLARFKNAKRRLEKRGVINGITVYDDFAHHPTAIAMTLAGLRRKVGSEKIIAVLEPRSNTMRMGVHANALIEAFADASEVYLYQSPEFVWDCSNIAAALGDRFRHFTDTDLLLQALVKESTDGDHILIMSNGGFENIHNRLLDTLAK